MSDNLCPGAQNQYCLVLPDVINFIYHVALLLESVFPTVVGIERCHIGQASEFLPSSKDKSGFLQTKNSIARHGKAQGILSASSCEVFCVTLFYFLVQTDTDLPKNGIVLHYVI